MSIEKKVIRDICGERRGWSLKGDSWMDGLDKHQLDCVILILRYMVHKFPEAGEYLLVVFRCLLEFDPQLTLEEFLPTIKQGLVTTMLKNDCILEAKSLSKVQRVELIKKNEENAREFSRIVFQSSRYRFD